MQTLSHLLSGLSFGMLLFLMASGLTLTFGLMGTLNMAHGAFYLVGGYLAVDFGTRTGSYWLALVLAVVIVGVVGVVFERLLLHRFLDNELAQIIVTLGFAFIVGDQLLAHYGGAPESVSRPPGLDGAVRSESFVFPVHRLAIIAVGCALAVAMGLLLTRTKIGARVRAAVDDETIARSVGVRVVPLFMTLFGCGAALAAFAGVQGGAFGTLFPGADFKILLLSLAVVVIGGVGSVSGALVAAIAVGLLNEFGTVLVPTLAQFLLWVPVVIFLGIRPQGIFGVREAAT